MRKGNSATGFAVRDSLVSIGVMATSLSVRHIYLYRKTALTEGGGRVNAPPLLYHRSYKRLPRHFVPRNDVVSDGWSFYITLGL